MNASKIYVGNLSYGTTGEDLRDFFAEYGEIAEVKLITDRETGRSKGFAFITFDNQQAAQKALSANGVEFQSRTLKVSIAKENTSRDSSGGGARRGGFRGGARREA